MTRVAIEVIPETNRGLEISQVIVAFDGVCGFEENVTRLIQLYDVSSRSVEPGNMNMMDINKKNSTLAGTKQKITVLNRTSRPDLRRDVNLVAEHHVFSSTRKARTGNQKNIVWPRTKLVQSARKKATTNLVVPKKPNLTPNPLRFAWST